MIRKTLMTVAGALLCLNAAGCSDQWWYDRWYADSPEVVYDAVNLNGAYAQFTCVDYGEYYGYDYPDIWLSAAVMFPGAADTENSFAYLEYDGGTYDMDPGLSFFWGGFREFNLYYLGYFYPDYAWFFQRLPEGLSKGSADEDYYNFFCGLWEGETYFFNQYRLAVGEEPLHSNLDIGNEKTDFNGGADMYGWYDVGCFDFQVPEATSCADLQNSKLFLEVEDYLNGGTYGADDPDTDADERVSYDVDVKCDTLNAAYELFDFDEDGEPDADAFTVLPCANFP